MRQQKNFESRSVFGEDIGTFLRHRVVNVCEYGAGCGYRKCCKDSNRFVSWFTVAGACNSAWSCSSAGGRRTSRSV